MVDAMANRHSGTEKLRHCHLVSQVPSDAGCVFLFWHYLFQAQVFIMGGAR